MTYKKIKLKKNNKEAVARDPIAAESHKTCDWLLPFLFLNKIRLEIISTYC